MTNQKEEKVHAFLQRLSNNQNVDQSLRDEASNMSATLSGPAYETDIWIYRAVIFTLAFTVISVILGGLALAWKGDSAYRLPAEIVAIGSAAVGALAGLLAPSPKAT